MRGVGSEGGCEVGSKGSKGGCVVGSKGGCEKRSKGCEGVCAKRRVMEYWIKGYDGEVKGARKDLLKEDKRVLDKGLFWGGKGSEGVLKEKCNFARTNLVGVCL